MADESDVGKRKLLTAIRCSCCDASFGTEALPDTVMLHYDRLHPGEGLRVTRDEDIRRVQKNRWEQERGEMRACNVRGCTKGFALLYGVSIENEALAAQAAFCGEHGAIFLLRAGELIGKLLHNR